MIFEDDSDTTITFVKGHRADDQPRHRRRGDINPLIILVILGVILLITSGVMINATLKIV